MTANQCNQLATCVDTAGSALAFDCSWGSCSPFSRTTRQSEAIAKVAALGLLLQVIDRGRWAGSSKLEDERQHGLGFDMDRERLALFGFFVDPIMATGHQKYR